MNNHKVVLVSIMLAVAASLLTLNPSMITTAQAEPYGDEYGYGYDSHPKKTDVNIQKIKCINSNVNVNGIDFTEIPQEPNGLAAAEAANEGGEGTNTENNDGIGGINFDRNLVNICANLNFNNQLRSEVPEFISGIIPFPG
ncbi:MAG TPA: hypothetical protein VJ767_05325 [Nitrososphaeraceae archaeon]|nr:hypothetical protein [Nitrososphaeraceae archaeon]